MKLILDTNICTIEDTGNEYIMRIRSNDGKYAVCKPHKRDIMGLVAALQASLDIVSGKIWIEKIESLQSLPNNNNNKSKFIEE